MARTVQDARLDSRTARAKLARRREPYWRTISEGIAIGYRRGAKGGTWIARHYTPEAGRRFQALGTSDDVVDADGVYVLSFKQAQEAARRWFADLARQDAGEVTVGPYTVADAMTDYLGDYERRGGKALDRMRYAIDAHILPALGSIDLSRLTRGRLESWLDAIAAGPARLRTRKGEAQQFADGDNTPEAIRRRRATANKVLNILKAALNHAYQNRRIVNAEAWTAVKPFREASAPKVRYLSDDECRRLVNACPTDLRLMVQAALLTGARYGELTALKAGDFDADAGTVTIGRSKSGKPRHIALTDEGRRFFEQATAGRRAADLVFLRTSGRPWQHAHQFRPLQDACAAARIDPAIGFHILRHTYGSRLAMRGVPMAVIAVQLGHADTRMTEKHYAHLAPSYVAQTVRAAFDSMGIVPETSVEPLPATRRGRKSSAG